MNKVICSKNYNWYLSFEKFNKIINGKKYYEWGKVYNTGIYLVKDSVLTIFIVLYLFRIIIRFPIKFKRNGKF